MALAFSDIALLVIDIDGTLTDAKLAWGGRSSAGPRSSACATASRYAVSASVASRSFPFAQWHAVRPHAHGGSRLPLDWLGVGDKLVAFAELRERYGVPPERIAYVGDGREDVPVFQLVGFPIAVADAHKSALAAARHVTRRAVATTPWKR